MPTLTVTEILTQTLASFKQRLPELDMISMDSTANHLRKGQSAIAHIRTLPSVGDYDAGNGGYFANGNEAKDLLEDVPVVMDGHKKVTISLTHLNGLSDRKIDMELGDGAYVLGKHILDSALAKVTALTVTEQTVESIANTTRGTLGKVRKAMNLRGALTNARYGLVSSDFYEMLDQDPAITSKDYHGAQIEGDALGELRAVAGFQKIREYPGLPAGFSGLFFDPRLMVVKTALPDHSVDAAKEMGIPQIASIETVKDPETGITLMGIKHMQPGTLDAYCTVTLLFGSAVGTQGGAAGAKTDYAGHRVVTA